MSAIVDTIRAKVRSVHQDEDMIGVLSTGEALAVALVLNRFDWLEERSYTMLQAVDRLGADWFDAARIVQRDGWE